MKSENPSLCRISRHQALQIFMATGVSLSLPGSAKDQ
jgi:hypothetical protein